MSKNNKEDLKNAIIYIWKSKVFQIGMDFCRILLILIAVAILYKLIVEIEAVKLLNYDPCALCMNKTGAECYLPDKFGNSNIYKPTININLTEELNKMILKNETFED